MGKVMHGARNNDPESWTMPFIANENFEYADGYKMPANLYQSPDIHIKWDSLQAALDADPNADRGWFAVNSVMKSAGLRPLTENLDVPDNAYADGASSLKTIELLNYFKSENKNFFLTVGFQKPHLPLPHQKNTGIFMIEIKLFYPNFRKGLKDHLRKHTISLVNLEIITMQSQVWIQMELLIKINRENLYMVTWPLSLT